MGRRKKSETEIIEPPKEGTLSGDIKRSLAAIMLFSLAILFVLGFLSGAKVLDTRTLGKVLNMLGGWLFGYGKFFSPLLLVAAGIVLLLRKETLFYVSKLLSFALLFASILGLIHVFFYAPEEALAAARAGVGGGFIGYFLAAPLTKFSGVAGAVVFLVALFLMSAVVAFNFSIVTLLRSLIRKIQREGFAEEDDDGEEIEQEEIIQKSRKGKATKEESPSEDAGVQFVRDPHEDEQEEDTEEKEDSVVKKVMQWTVGKSKTKTEEREIPEWELPGVSLLETSSGKAQGGDVKKNAKIIQDTFKHFGIDVEPGEIKTGPTVTQYSFRPAVGVKLSRITGLGNDLALALAAHPIRIEAPIPGKSLIGIEVPNKSVATVRLGELLGGGEFLERQSNLLLALGKDVSGSFIYGDLKKMPHLMIAGSTGAGKSVCVNTIILSMLYQNSPEDLKLILVDPKRVELSLYNGIPHLLSDVIVENSKVLNALKWSIGEMERRYKLLQEVGSRDIASYNQKAQAKEVRMVSDPNTDELREETLQKLPYIVIIIDELADLMATHGKEVEGAIIRLAQMARAVGIHLIVSTQRPSVEVITGLIKANIPTRIAFKVATQIDSRTILDASGAEKLLGNGDMLFSTAAGMRRLQGVYVSEAEVKRVVDFIRKQKVESGEEELGEEITGTEESPDGNGPVTSSFGGELIDFGSAVESDHGDPLYEEAKKVVMQAGKASTSLLQRRLRVGYSRAARLVDVLEEQGVIGPADGAKPREVLVSSAQTAYEDSLDDQAVRDKWQM
ncbi:MAG TPA: DNA translocase FtsK 4TM domain-containing protein [Candidatus Moranbacteria bacterium]|nr:DNA translocase FtsK 4TM domain-containing protein [Candidatus Moranbacteria bacterium]